MDLAAYNHDVRYDELDAEGFKGAILDLKVLVADIQLYIDAKNVLVKADNGVNDAITGKKNTRASIARARLIMAAFKPIIENKQVREIITPKRNIEGNLEKDEGVKMDGGIRAQYDKIKN